jgi:non-ribosomal peptide synthetase component F
MVLHSNLVNFLAWEQAAFAHTPRDVFLQKTPTNFDVSIEELWTPLVTGASLVIAKPNGHKDTAYLLELIERHGVTNLSMVPSQVGVSHSVSVFLGG